MCVIAHQIKFLLKDHHGITNMIYWLHNSYLNYSSFPKRSIVLEASTSHNVIGLNCADVIRIFWKDK